MVYDIMNDKQRKAFEEFYETDFSFEIPKLARFRVNAFNQNRGAGAVFRNIPSAILTLDELNAPKTFKDLCMLPRGLVLVTGPTGSGKSTTLAGMVNHCNDNRPDHIITIEDPIEFLHRDKRSFINQREVEVDTANFSTALRAGLRQDPDVILVGEMRDLETISTALLAAETGHLVFSTLHTLDATETIQRIIAVFPPPEQKQIRLQMAATLKAVISQRLVRRAVDKGRVPAVEIMIATAYIRDCVINADKTRLIHDAIAAGTSQYGMQTFDQSLFDLYTKELITLEEALTRASNADEFKLRIQGIRSAADAAREEMERQMADFERFARK
jgi:twitching motility protein PilT